MRFIRDYIVKDFKLKALSLVLAAMLWFAISYIGESKMTVSVPIMVSGLGKEYIMEKMDSDAVLVTISGPISILKNLRAHDVRLEVGLSGVKAGTHVFTLRRDNVTVPKGTRVEEVKPDYLTVEIDKAVEMRLKVVVKLDPKWTGIYGIKSWYPHYATVEGSEEALKGRTVVETIPVSGNLREKEEEVDVPLAVKGMQITKTKPETVRVRLRRN